MPRRVFRVLDSEKARNKAMNVIPGLATLLEADQSVECAYLCRPNVFQIAKLPGEGSHFCGYRNMQMLLLNPRSIDSVFKLQEMIETAWDLGYNSHGRVETGGIKGTRKHVGASEVGLAFVYFSPSDAFHLC